MNDQASASFGISSTTDRHYIRHIPRIATWPIAVAGAFVVGMLTNVGQAGTEFLASLSNSAGPWFTVTVLLVLLVRARLRWAMPLGFVCLELMNVGYWAAATMRGIPDQLSLTDMWVLLAVPAGALAGLVAVWIDGANVLLRVAGFGVIGAILIGEGVRGLLQVAETTGVVFWIVEICVGVLVIARGAIGGRTRVERFSAPVTGIVGGSAVLAAYLLLGSG